MALNDGKLFSLSSRENESDVNHCAPCLFLPGFQTRVLYSKVVLSCEQPIYLYGLPNSSRDVIVITVQLYRLYRLIFVKVCAYITHQTRCYIASKTVV